MGLVAIGKRKLRDMVHLRSKGDTIAEVAWKLELAPWHVSYLTRFVKLCVTREEYQWLCEEAERWKFGTVGEFVMDVVNRLYDDYYAQACGYAKKKTKAKKAA